MAALLVLALAKWTISNSVELAATVEAAVITAIAFSFVVGFVVLARDIGVAC